MNPSPSGNYQKHDESAVGMINARNAELCISNLFVSSNYLYHNEARQSSKLWGWKLVLYIISVMCFWANMCNRLQHQQSRLNWAGCDHFGFPVHTILKGHDDHVSLHLFEEYILVKNVNTATFLITKDLSSEWRQDVGQWSHPLIWRIRSLAQARGRTLSRPLRRDFPPATGRSHRVG